MASQTVRVEGLRGVLDTLKALPPEIVSKAGGPVKLALKKAAEVLRDEARANVRRIVSDPNASGIEESTGLLEQNIVAARTRPAPGLNGERYLVRVRKKRYTDKPGKPVVTPQVGRLLEYGTETRQPMPWLRPAFDAKKQEAVDTFVREVNSRAEKIIAKLSREAARKK